MNKIWWQQKSQSAVCWAVSGSRHWQDTLMCSFHHGCVIFYLSITIRVVFVAAWVCVILSPWMQWQLLKPEWKQWAGETSVALQAAPSSLALAETWWITCRGEKNAKKNHFNFPPIIKFCTNIREKEQKYCLYIISL